MRKEKAALEGKAPEGMVQAEHHPQTLTHSPEEMAVIQQKLQSMANDLHKVDSLVKVMSGVTVLLTAAQELGTDMHRICPYQKDDLCTLHIWSSESDIPQGIGEPVGDENREWYIKPSPLHCAMCVIPLGDRIDNVEDKISDNPLFGARHQITCKSCGSKGWIAAKIMCTKCQRETYFGWWPKKE